MKKPLAGAALVLLAAAAAGGAVLYLKNPAPPASVPQKRAQSSYPPVLGLEWGSTVSETERRLGRPLAAPAPDPLFYRLVEPSREAESRIFEAPLEYAGLPGIVRLLFEKDALRAYFVFLDSRDPNALDAAIRAELTRTYGPRYLGGKEGDPLRAIWPLQEVDVNYWFVSDDFKLVPAYRAAVGVRWKGEK